jgi:DsbC/DsbD-like thiol-disulfide interchange protein
MKHIPFAALFALLFVLSPVAAQAQIEGLISAEIVQGGRDVDGKPMAAIVLTLQQGWKTYWRSPGEGGGIPPEIDWTGSRNLAGADMIWPAPIVWGDVGMTNIGYQDRLILPLALSPIDPAQSLAVQATISFGICKDICIPAFATLSADVSGNLPAEVTITQALADAPQSAQALGAADVSCTFAPIKDGVRVTAHFSMPPLAHNAAETVVFEHRDRSIWASGTQVTRQGDHVTAVADLVPPTAKPFDLNGNDLRMTILADGRAAELIGCPLN